MAVFGKKEETKSVPELPKPAGFSPYTPGTQSSLGTDASSTGTSLDSPPSLPAPSSSLSLPAPSSLPSLPAPSTSPSFPTPPLPTPPSFTPPAHESSSSQELLTEDIEKIAESIIDEKWDKVKGELDDLKTWKVDLDTQVKGFKSQLDTLGKRVDDAQNAMLGKVEEYNKSLGGVNVEIMAMGKVFEKIIPQFTENVNKLSELVDRKASKTKK
jgi:hypothetical protein